MPRHPLTEDELAATRARILAEAARIVGAAGYAALSMRRLAEAVGLTAGALYRYFPSKQQVLIAYWSEALDALHRRLAGFDADGRPSVAVLRDMLIAYGRFALDDPDRFRLMFLENDDGQMDEFGRQPHVFAAYDLVRDRVARAIVEKSLRPLPPDTATRILWGAVHGVAALIIAVEEMDFGDVDALLRLTAETVLRGLTEPSQTT
jgi:AcrR family transcriptional regulator